MTLSTLNTHKQNNFNLLNWFSIYGLLVIVFISTCTSLLLSTFLEQHLITRDAKVLKDFVSKMSEHHDPLLYFSSSYARNGTQMNDFFADIEHMPDVARINAYNRDNIIVWSSDSAIIGQQFPGNHELEEALEGELVFEKGDISKLEKPEHLLLAAGLDWFVENYIPILDPSTKKVVGAVEIYRIPIELTKTISYGKKLIWISVSSGSLLLYIILFGVIRYGQQKIQDQQHILLGQTRVSTIGEMASSVAHSLRNPIASIRSSAELTLDESPSLEITENIEDIVREVDRFEGWIKELLTYTSESADPAASADISDVINTSLRSISERAKHIGIKVFKTLPDNGQTVRGDPGLLVQLFNSLISNALDAMPQGGQLIIEASNSGVGRETLITLTDTGFGIPADQLDTLFDPLAARKKGSLGIGLALARQIVQSYSGSIHINSTVGSGTKVTVILPSHLS